MARSSPSVSTRRAIVVVAAVFFVVLITPGVYRALRPAKPDTIPWRTDFGAALEEARTSGKLVLLDFTATWCPPCNVMKRETFPDERVKAAVLADYIPVKLDVDLAENKRPSERYAISTIPTLIITDAEGVVVDAEGFMTAERMLKFLEKNKSSPRASATMPSR